ncbi:peptidoglycan bridge formation glycyltransferase FemA/FemB family protein [Candidatus Roizmanbacteria bacterium]|nr:peptidoglycan bridge formation glycyltransferase FemA/FemB family protein [Candidatus Roizmanbacteria bacterium]
MQISIIPEQFDKDRYNKNAIHPLQSWEWGEARKALGTEVVRIGEFDNGNLVNVYQLTLHPIPHTLYKIGYLPRSRFPSNTVLDFLKDYGQKHNVIFIKLEAYELSNDRLTSIIKRSPHPLFPDWTIIVDLTQSEEQLLTNMKPKTRYNIRLAQRKGVQVKESSDDEGFQIFLKLYFETCRRQRYFGHNEQYHKMIWQHLKQHTAHILIAYYENTPIAAYELFHFRDTLYYPYGGSSLLYKNIMAPNVLMWEAMLFGKKLGATKFDLWGSLPPDHEGNESWRGFTRFKEGYGGKLVRMVGSYDLIISPLLYNVYNIIYRFRNLYLKWRL